MLPSGWKTGKDLLGAGAKVGSVATQLLTLDHESLTSVVHPQTDRAHNSHGNEIHQMKPEPFGEHKTLNRTPLSGRAPMGVVLRMHVVARSIGYRCVVSGGGGGLGTAKHRAL